MDYRPILHMITPLPHVSPFDVNMAVDAGYQTVVPYIAVKPDQVTGLVQDAIFSRGPRGAKATGMFIGGRNAEQALDMLDAARRSMVPPFEISVFADPAGSFTTAAAMVAKVGKLIADKHGGGWSGRSVVVFGGTGVVGFAAGVIAAEQGAVVTLVGYDGDERVRHLAEVAERRFKVKLGHADGSKPGANARLAGAADIVLAAARAGVQVLSTADLARAGRLLVAADVNAVPPAGIEGLGVQDDGKPIGGGKALGIGALAIGVVKSKVQGGLFRRMIEAGKPLYIDFRDAFALAREIVG
jgi:methylene-tetrahydromethanopterin dehydrogenase